MKKENGQFSRLEATDLNQKDEDKTKFISGEVHNMNKVDKMKESQLIKEYCEYSWRAEIKGCHGE